MASPFGLAYGIGAGLAGVPGAIEQGQERAMAMSMRQLALDEARRKREQEEATQAIMSRDYPAPEASPMTIQTAGIPANYGTATDVESGVAMPPEVAAQRGIGTPAVPGKSRTIAPLENPNVIQAHKMILQSQALRQAGNWPLAVQLENQARTLGVQGVQEVRQEFGSAIEAGQYDRAVSALHGVGMRDVVDITPSPDMDGVVFHSANGGQTHVDEDSLQKIVNPNIPPKTAMDLYYKRQALAQKAEALRQNIQFKKEHETWQSGENQLNRESRERMARASQAVRSALPGQKIQLVDRLKASLIQGGMDPVQAEAEALNKVMAGAGAFKDVAAQQAPTLLKIWGNNPPLEGEPMYPLYKSALDVAGETMGKRPRTPSVPPASAPKVGGSKGITVGANGQVTASTNPNIKVGTIVKKNGKLLPAGNY